MFNFGSGKITCGESQGKKESVPLIQCIANITNHLKSCHLSRVKVSHYELILARAGKFNLPLDEIEKLTICPKHRHNLGQYWRPQKTCQYPNHEGRKISLHCKNPVNWQMAQDRRCLLHLHKLGCVSIFFFSFRKFPVFQFLQNFNQMWLLLRKAKKGRNF